MQLKEVGKMSFYSCGTVTSKSPLLSVFKGGRMLRTAASITFRVTLPKNVSVS